MGGILATAAINWISGWFENRAEVGKAKAAATAERVKTHLAGWSDEFLVLVWSYPFISVFIPFLAPYTKQGFENLALLPEWYVAGFITITFAVFGIDKLFAYKRGRSG